MLVLTLRRLSFTSSLWATQIVVVRARTYIFDYSHWSSGGGDMHVSSSGDTETVRVIFWNATLPYFNCQHR